MYFVFDRKSLTFTGSAERVRCSVSTDEAMQCIEKHPLCMLLFLNKRFYVFGSFFLKVFLIMDLLGKILILDGLYMCIHLSTNIRSRENLSYILTIIFIK